MACRIFASGLFTYIPRVFVSLVFFLPVTGSLEAAFSILALRDGVVPHTLNLATPDPTFGFTMVKGAPVGGGCVCVRAPGMMCILRLVLLLWVVLVCVRAPRDGWCVWFCSFSRKGQPPSLAD